MYVRPRPRFRPRNAGTGFQPSLALDFTSGTLNSAITFSRGTQATQYGSNGLLRYAPNNLLTYSNQADNAAWTKSNSFVQTNLLLQSEDFTTTWSNVGAALTISANAANSPIGTSTADLLTPTTGSAQHRVDQTPVSSAGPQTFSVYAKFNGYSFVSLRISGVGCAFNISTGTAGTLTATSASIQSVGNGWYRCSVYVAAALANDICRVNVENSDTIGSVFAGDGVSGIYVWGAQLVQGSVPGDYRATTSAALPVLYADYQGNLRARKLCENAAVTVGHQIQENITCAIATYTTSVYAKAGERTKFAVDMSDNISGEVSYTFDLVAGTASSPSTGGSWSGLTASITNIGNGWYRCSITALRGAGTSTIANILVANAAGSVSYTGDGSSGIYIADAQLEAGSTVQAYNDTTSAAYYGPRFDYDPTNYVRQNLLLQSEQFDNAAWNKTNAGAGIPPVVTANQGVAPDGTLTADRVDFNCGGTTISDRSWVSQTISITQGLAYTDAIWIKAFDAATVGKTIRFIVENGGGSAPTVFTITSDWQRISVAGTAATASTVNVLIETRGTVTSSTTASVLLWGAQLNTGSTALTYTATTTAPYTLCAARGLLIEEQRVNLLLQSNDFQTSWSPTNVTRTLASTTGPDGTLSGVKIEATTAAATILYQAAAITSTSATYSVYLKQGTGATTANSFLLRNSTTATNLVGGTLNYSTGVFTYTTGSTGVSVTNVGNGWWRLQMSASTGITASDVLLAYAGFVGSVATAGDFLYAYGAQLEAGAFATSYIPTVGSQVTRAADSASITTLTPWYNSAAGTLFASVSYEAAANGPVGDYNVSISDGTISNIILIGSAGSVSCQLISGGVSSYNQGVGTRPAIGVVQKTAFAYSAVDANQAVNGTLGTTDTTTVVPSAVTKLSIGSRGDNSGYLNGWVNTLNYYPTRLPNATLQGLTV